MLNDLAVKRKALHIQIDQLRAARDSMNTFVSSVREQIDALLDNINGSDEAARAAALEALRMRPPSPDLTEEELLAGTPLRHVPEPQLQMVAPSSAVSNLEPRHGAYADGTRSNLRCARRRDPRHPRHRVFRRR